MNARPKVHKTSVVVFILADEELLMQSTEHQGADIFDVFGSFIAEGDTPQNMIDAKVIEVIGDGYSVEPFGHVLDHIEKPEASVDLFTPAFRVLMNSEEKALYRLKDGQLWMPKESIEKENRIRHGDRLIFMRAFEDRPMNIELSEDQYEKWIDAKLTSWEEKD